MAAKVDDKAGWYREQEDRWEVSCTLLGGTEAIRKCSEYLPQFPLEPDDHYKVRREQAVLTNFYTQIANRMIGLVFREKVKVTDSLIPKEILENIDNCGRDVHAFAESIAVSALTAGIHHILVDVPPNPGAVTAQDDKALNLRPFWVSINAKTCINAFASSVANQEVLRQVRYKDDTHELSGFDITCINRIRVLNLDNGAAKFETWVKMTDGGEYELSSEDNGDFKAKGGKPLAVIPWVTVYGAHRDGFMTARSVIQDIAYHNIAHFQVSSGYRNVVDVASFPMRCETGTPEPQRAVGPAIVLHSQGNSKDHQEAKFYYIEPTGAGANVAKDFLTKTVEDSEMLAIQLRVDPAQTATGADITQGSTTSNLVTFAHGLEQGLNEALAITADYLGIDRKSAGKVEVNKDFTLSAEEQSQITALLKMAELGKLSDETLWTEMQKLGVLSPDFDADAEAELVAGQDMGPTPPQQTVVTPPVEDAAATS